MGDGERERMGVQETIEAWEIETERLPSYNRNGDTKFLCFRERERNVYGGVNGLAKERNEERELCEYLY